MGTARTSYYTNRFYDKQVEGAFKSAQYYARYLSKLLEPKSIVDVGCGRGAWLKAFKEEGAIEIAGIDGYWNTQSDMIDPKIIFHSADLNNIPSPKNKYDLAMSLELAEHLEAASADNFVKGLCSYSDAILFSAAYPGQGGKDHINEQPHTYWAEKFQKNGYNVYDLFRPVFWGEENIEFWYRQNTFLYVKIKSQPEDLLKAKGFVPMPNKSFMDCVHPGLYTSRINPKKSIKLLLPPILSIAFKRTLKLFKK